MRVALITFNTIAYQELADITLPGKLAYCNRHGYDLLSGPYVGQASWDRVAVVAQNLHKYDAVMWIDCDAVITNLTKPLTDLLQPDDHFLISADLYGPNTGVFIALNTPLCQQFLYAVLNAGPQLVKYHHWNEQEAIIRFLQSPPYTGVARYVPQNAMNSYINSELKRPDWFMGNYQPGDWIVHLAGVPYERKLLLARSLVDAAIT